MSFAPPSTRTVSLAHQQALENAGLRVGYVIDAKYQIERVLGSGGMGLVLAATHLTLRQEVAIKLLLPSSLDDHVVVARFEREARAAAMLKSDHVARVLDVGRIVNGSPYMVMELLEGSDLEQVVEDTGPIAADVAVNYVLQACQAIAEAHALGIVHRDLKPHNLFLAQRIDGETMVKVLDFGISKLQDEDDHGLTRTRDVMGSPLYMAPEQLRSAREVDPRADVWALGAILFRLITGRTPFDGETMAQLCSRVLVDPPAPIRALQPDIPEGLAKIIERCLEKDPLARFPDVAELARALDPFAANTVVRPADRVIAISTRPPPASSTKSVPPAPVSIPPSMATVRIGAYTGKSMPPIAAPLPPPVEAPARRRPVLFVSAVLLALVAGAAGAWTLRGRAGASTASTGSTASTAPTASIAPVVTVSAAPPVVSAPLVVAVAEPTPSAAPSAEPAPTHSHRRPPHRPPPASSASSTPATDIRE